MTTGRGAVPARHPAADLGQEQTPEAGWKTEMTGATAHDPTPTGTGIWKTVVTRRQIVTVSRRE
jgi:hypothetical protein